MMLFSRLFNRNILIKSSFKNFGALRRCLRAERCSAVKWIKALKDSHGVPSSISTRTVESQDSSFKVSPPSFESNAPSSDGQLVTKENQLDKLAEAVCPLWSMPYADQLNLKWKRNRVILEELGNKLKEVNSPCKIKKHLPCPLHDIIPSPVQDEYRNKDDFKIKHGVDGNPKTVGFLVGSVSDDTAVCVNPIQIINTKQSHKKVAKCFEDYIRLSNLPICDLFIEGGNWRNLVVRSNLSGDIMASVVFYPQDLNEEAVKLEKQKLMEYFTSGNGRDCNLKSLYFQQCTRINYRNKVISNELLFGDKYIYENLLGMKFCISPDSFFQVNTQAAEYLYKSVLKLANINNETVVLDVCSGIGAISLTIAPHARAVIGIESNKQAVKDANVNAQMNGIRNATFLCGQAEEILPNLISSLTTHKVVAVLNPTRGGVHREVIRSLRKCPQLEQIVYISCHPKGNVISNFLDLAKPSGPKLRGEPFVPKVAIPIDLFPHTEHCELILVMERVS